MIRKIARLSFTVGVLAVSWLSLAPQDALPEINMWDKLQHAMTYTALAICGAVGFLGRRPLLMIGVGLIVLGCSLEAAQRAALMRRSTMRPSRSVSSAQRAIRIKTKAAPERS